MAFRPSRDRRATAGWRSLVALSAAAFASTSLVAIGDGAASATPNVSTTGGTLVGGSLEIGFGTAAGNVEFVNSLVWSDSAGNKTANLAANGGPLSCGDPREFTGQAYGAPESGQPATEPMLVVGGTRGTWRLTTPHTAVITDMPQPCGEAATPGIQTTYRLFSAHDPRHNEVKITRRFGFWASTPVFPTAGFRPYVPRVPLSLFPNVIFPNKTGTALNSIDATSCAFDCFETDWNGTWMADDNGAGRGVVLLRDPRMRSAAELTVNNDDFSASNLSSIVLLQPASGWTSPVEETEYLCFYDQTSWPTSRRARLLPPVGCGPSAGRGGSRDDESDGW